MGISLNTGIGLSLIAAIPALAIWFALSLHVWAAGGRIWRWDNYRLAVTYFLLALTLVIADQSRVRFAAWIGPVSPDKATWLVLAIRWNFTVAVWWGTIVLYGHYIPRLLRFTQRRRPAPPAGEHDPYLDDDARIVMIHAKEQRAFNLSMRLRLIAEELNAIIDRIERDDDPLILPKDGRRKDRA